MIVSGLIAALQELDALDEEVGYSVSANCLHLLIGSDEDTGQIVTIPKPQWC